LVKDDPASRVSNGLDQTVGPMGARILVVDDDADVCDVISMILRDHGYDVACAYTAAEARKSVADERPDVVLVDVHLRERGDGLTLAAELAQEGIALALMSADPIAADEVASLPFPFIAKPFRSAELIEVVARTLARC
jgi:CheY-like chemotaxis protein